MPILTGSTPRLMEFDVGMRPRDKTLNPLKVGSDDIFEWVKARDPRAIRDWNEIGKEEHARSFAVARTAGQDVIDDLYRAFYRVIEQGGTEVDFEELVIPTLRAKGWLPGLTNDALAHRVRFIYFTNLRLAQGAGQWSRYWGTRTAIPYIRCVTARDGRVRHPPHSPDSDHRAWEGIVLPIDHPFFTRWWIPLGFSCRCNVIPMSRSQLARTGMAITTEADLAAREAQLGTPIFATPALGTAGQIRAMADATNESSMPGARTIDPGLIMSRGAQLWSQVLAGQATVALDDLLARLFGNGG